MTADASLSAALRFFAEPPSGLASVTRAGTVTA
jgi:hypothetical protein